MLGYAPLRLLIGPIPFVHNRFVVPRIKAKEIHTHTHMTLHDAKGVLHIITPYTAIA